MRPVIGDVSYHVSERIVSDVIAGDDLVTRDRMRLAEVEIVLDERTVAIVRRDEAPEADETAQRARMGAAVLRAAERLCDGWAKKGDGHGLER